MSILIFLIMLVALILVHELGHFVVAKQAGVRVDEFGIGFPPRLWGKRIGETLYSINALPFGGFVRIFGEDPDKESVEGPDRARSLAHKPWHTQASVIVAGVVMNVLLAWVLFIVGFTVGVPQSVFPGQTEDAHMLISSVLRNSPAEEAGLKAGDILVSLEAPGLVPLAATDPAKVSQFIAEHGSETVTLHIVRGGKEQEIEAIPETGLVSSDSTRAALGVGLGLVSTDPLPFFKAVYQATLLTGSSLSAITVSIVHFIASAFTFSADFSQVAGPVGIVGLVDDTSRLGFVALLSFAAFISLNLAVINLLPFPALDGGRLLFTLIEVVIGKRLNQNAVNTANSVGFVLLIVLMIAVTWNDILRLLG